MLARLEKKYLAHPSQLTYYTGTQNQLNIIAIAQHINFILARL